jgi:hypothetical protein|eukprot:COSAG01_NODE_3367_length_6187_cov_26.119087_3_plen_100_part_00
MAEPVSLILMALGAVVKAARAGKKQWDIQKMKRHVQEMQSAYDARDDKGHKVIKGSSKAGRDLWMQIHNMELLLAANCTPQQMLPVATAAITLLEALTA